MFRGMCSCFLLLPHESQTKYSFHDPREYPDLVEDKRCEIYGYHAKK